MSKASEKYGYDSIFPTRFRNLMDNNKVNQKTMAEICGVQRQSISQWYNGETRPDILSLGKIAEYFNASTDYLLGLNDNKTTDRATKELCNTLGLSEETIDILSANPNSILANEFRTKVSKEDYRFDDEEFNEELIEGDAMMLAEAYSYKTSKVINWLINDFINAQLVAINNCSDYWTESSLIELFYDFIESLDTSKDFSVSDVSKGTTKIDNKFSLELSSLLVHKKGGDYFWVRQNVKELLINSAIGEINTRLHNIKHERLD